LLTTTATELEYGGQANKKQTNRATYPYFCLLLPWRQKQGTDGRLQTQRLFNQEAHQHQHQNKQQEQKTKKQKNYNHNRGARSVSVAL
jgi:hypothetical protein